MNNNIKNIGIPLQDIVKNCQTGLYLIPNFQRGFVWKKRDIIDLGDSIIRGYPISSLLLIPENGALKIVSKNLIEKQLIEMPNGNTVVEEDSSTKFYVLDGQQRLTSITKLFLSCDDENAYYYDLLAILADKFPYDKIEENSAFVKSKRLESFSSLCHSFAIGRDKSEQPSRKNYRYISGKTIITNQYSAIINKFLATLQNISEPHLDKYINYLNTVLGAVNSYNISATEISRDAELGIIIRIFEKVNSTGMKLTLFDLINAKSYQAKNDYRSDGLSIFLKKRIDSAITNQPELREALYCYFKYDEITESYQGLAHIIHILEITFLLNKNQAPAMSGTIMLNRDPEHWFQLWEQHEHNLFNTLNWFYQQQIIGTASSSFIEYMVAVFLAAPDALHYPTFKAEIQRYAFYHSIHNLSFNKSNLDTVEKFYSAAQKENDTQQQKLNIVNLTGSKFEVKDVLECTAKKAKFRAVLTILYLAANSKKSVDYETNVNHVIHYLYPQKLIDPYSNQFKFNSVANAIYLPPSIDEKKVKDLPPYSYLALLRQQITSSQFIEYCQNNLIDFEQVDNLPDHRLYEVINIRAKKIATIVNNYFEHR